VTASARVVRIPELKLLGCEQSMPYKFNDGRRRKIPKAKYRVTNWPDYDAALVRRGSLTVWVTEDKPIGGMACAVTGRAAVNRFIPIWAIETGLSAALGPPSAGFAQTEGALRSIADLLGLEIRIRTIRLPAGAAAALMILPERVERNEPLHLLVRQHRDQDLQAKANGLVTRSHGVRHAAAGVKLHLAVDADTNEIAAVELTRTMSAMSRPLGSARPGPRVLSAR